MRNEQAPPVSEGEEHDVTIEAVGEKGDGIAKVNGFVLFVANTNAGERKRVKITKVLANVGFAEAIGDAKTQVTPKRGKRERAPKKEEPEFDPKPELDSEEF